MFMYVIFVKEDQIRKRTKDMLWYQVSMVIERRRKGHAEITFVSERLKAIRTYVHPERSIRIDRLANKEL